MGFDPAAAMSAAQLIRASQGRSFDTQISSPYEMSPYGNHAGSGLTNSSLAAFDRLAPTGQYVSRLDGRYVTDHADHLGTYVEGLTHMNGQYVSRLVQNVQLPFQEQNLADLHDTYAQRNLRADSFPHQLSGAFDQECSNIHDALDRLDLLAPAETGPAPALECQHQTEHRFDVCSEIHQALNRLDAEPPFVDTAPAPAPPTRAAALAWVAPESPNHQVAAIEQLFKEVDTDNDGSISPGELKKALTGRRKEKLRSMFGALNLDWKDVFIQLDTDVSGKISLKEFIAGCTNDAL